MKKPKPKPKPKTELFDPQPKSGWSWLIGAPIDQFRPTKTGIEKIKKI